MARTVVDKAPKPVKAGPDKARAKSLANVGKRFSMWRPAPQVLVEVQAVPTRFVQLNRTSRVGGWPTARFGLVHGPSNEGKTELVHGLGGSFLDRDHFYCLIDAENTTPHSWVRQLVGPGADSPGFLALRPTTYEETVVAVRQFCEGIADSREKGEIEQDTTALIVVDSIRKLVPANILKTLIDELGVKEGTKRANPRDAKKPPKGVDGFGGRAGQVKAALNAAWLDELIPLLAQTNVAMVAITRETKDDSIDAFAAESFKTGGGSALFYDSSLVVRVTRDCFLYESKEQGAPIIGEKRAVEVHKTKVAGRDERWPTAYYFTSNGRQSPVGFDRAHDVLDLAVQLNVVQVNGSWLAFDGKNLGQGMSNALDTVRADVALCTRIEGAIEAHDVQQSIGLASSLTAP